MSKEKKKEIKEEDISQDEDFLSEDEDIQKQPSLEGKQPSNGSEEDGEDDFEQKEFRIGGLFIGLVGPIIIILWTIAMTSFF
jgi:hypothetical protein